MKLLFVITLAVTIANAAVFGWPVLLGAATGVVLGIVGAGLAIRGMLK